MGGFMKKKIICLCVAMVILFSAFTLVLFSMLQKDEEDVITTTQTTTMTGEAVMLEKYVKTYENNADLYINGQNVSEQTCVRLYTQKKRCVVSLMYIALYLGCAVYENTENEYTIVYGDDSYTLNTLENTMKINNNPMNIIGDPDPIVNPDAESANHHIDPYYKRTEADYLIDSNTLNHFLYLLNYEMLIDYKCATVNISKANNPPVKLVVNSKVLPIDENIRINNKELYAEIPLFSVLKECGFEITQIEDGKYSLRKDKEKLILDTKNNILSDRKCSDYFKLIVGGKVWYYYKKTNDDYYISTYLVVPLLYDFGYRTEIDYENSIISINKLAEDTHS